MGNSFDPVAGIYDDTFSNALIGKAQRDIVWEYLRGKNIENKNILEINCGTGVDAIFLSKNNTVTASDASEIMLKIIEEKIRQNALQRSCKTLLWDLNYPFPGDGVEKFDLVFSNFGGLNCLSPEALKNLSGELYNLLKPDGKMIFVVMGRKCIWESLYFILKGKFKSAFRRRSKQVIKAQLTENTFVDTYYYSPRELVLFFKQNFTLRKKLPVGFFIPPSYLEPFFKRKNRLLQFLSQLDRRVNNIGILSNYADHYLIELEKS